MSSPRPASASTPSRLQAGLERLRAEWEAGYPDLPWSGQPLRVEVDADVRATEFHVIFTHLAAMPSFDVEWRQPRAAGAGNVGLEIEVPQDSPGLLLKLKGFDSSEIRSIILRQDPLEVRVSGIVCLQKDEARGEWIVIYNTADRVRSVKQVLSACLPPAKGTREENLHGFLHALVEQDFPRAAGHLAKAGPAASIRSELGWLTDRFQVQANAHGVKRTFRFWSETEKQAYLRKALDIVAVLQRLTPNACISGGAVLGHRREGKLLDHDDDLDIVVGVGMQQFGGLGPTLEAIAQALTAEGFKVKGHFFAHLWIETDTATGQTLDVFVAILEDERASFYPSRRRALAASDLFPAAMQRLEGIDVPMPRSIDGYLNGVYGSSWHTPDPDFHHPWDRSEYADLSGPRRRHAIWTRGELQANERRKAAGG